AVRGRGHGGERAPLVALRVVLHDGERLAGRGDGRGDVGTDDEGELRARQRGRGRRGGTVHGDLGRRERRPAERQQAGQRLSAEGRGGDGRAGRERRGGNGDFDRRGERVRTAV